MHGVMVQPCPKCGLFVKDVDGIRVSHAGLALAGQQGITISNMHVDAALKIPKHGNCDCFSRFLYQMT